MNKFIYTILSLCLLPLAMQAQTYTMGSGGGATTCSGTFYDSGGPSGDYGNSETFTYTFCPSTPGDAIELDFASFSIESGFDNLTIYDGNNTSAPSLGTFTGTNSPGVITATVGNPSGCLTVEFTSDGSVTDPGWEASISCVAPVVPPPIVNMNNGSTNTCAHDFFDNGGVAGDYSNSQSLVHTFCPSTPGSNIQVDFTSFELESGFDFLSIYDGNSTGAALIGTYSGTTSPGTITATSGCLTFEFTSDGSVTDPGWAATISCDVACQTITPNLTSANPTVSGDGIIRICQGTSVSLTGNATFSSSGVGATYQWNMGDGTIINGSSVTHTYSDSGSYFANLIVQDPLGCTNTTFIDQEIRVSTTPTITSSSSAPTVCTGNTINLTGNATPVPYTPNCSPPIAGTTFLPDGSGVSYTTSIPVNCYATGQTITSAADIQNICLTLEHSYLGDLNIEIICPNGQQATLHEYPGGGSTFLGAPIDDVTSGPGTGFPYCFDNTSTTLLVNGPTILAGSPTASNSIDSGSYMPADPFSNLIGCPVNGNWTIEVTDNLSADDGYIFNWDIDFGPSVTAASSFTPTITSETWTAAPGLTNTGAGTADVTPPAGSAGVTDYYYSVTDNFGCTYEDTVQVTVNETSTAPTIAPMVGTYCPNTTLALTASGGIAGTGSTIEWYSGPNGTGAALGTGANLNINTGTGTNTYYVRREGACNNTADDMISINTKTYIYGLNGATTNNYCTDNAGWHHFYSGNEIILSIQGDLSGAPAGFPQVTINDNGSFFQQTQGPFAATDCAAGWSPGEERFEMERSWNVDFGGGVLIPPYNVRFYYEPAERAAIETAAANWMATYPACSYTYKYPFPQGFYWFKNAAGNYTAPDYDGIRFGDVPGTTFNGINYTEMSGVTSFSGGSGAIILIPDPLLSVEWISFDGHTDNKTNFLNWTTESEQGVVEYYVQRSQAGTNFETIGTVAAKGHSSSKTTYSFDDVNPFSGANYYRIQSINEQGEVEYTRTIMLVINDPTKGYSFYPNPTDDVVFYHYETDQVEGLTIEVLDILGRTLHTQETNSAVGINDIKINLSGYKTGSYLIKVHNNRSGSVHTTKVIKN